MTHSPMFRRAHYAWLADWARNAAMAVPDLDRSLMISSLCDCLEHQANADGTPFNRNLFLKACKE